MVFLLLYRSEEGEEGNDTFFLLQAADPGEWEGALLSRVKVRDI